MNKRKYIISFSIACLALGACKKSAFVSDNLNPDVLYSVDPADQFLAAAAGCQDDFEYFYDVYRLENNWMQYTTGAAGNTPGFARVGSNFNERYSKIFYGRTGTYLSDMTHLVSQMKPGDQAKRVWQLSIGAIFKAYYAFYVSDINGDIPYTQAFQARYGGTFTPVYDRQQVLFDTLDAQIKAAVKVLETPQTATQTPIGAKDPFFPSNLAAAPEAAQWAKIGNALRLKIAMRLMKRDPAKMKAIVTDVLADGSNQMASVDDSWVLYAGPAYANGNGQTNWNSTTFCAGKPVVDFMNLTGDPREAIFYRPALYTNTYVGAPTSPDDVAPNANKFLHSDSTYSQLQHRLFTPNYDEGNGAGTGIAFFPLMTYAEYCFIRAELGFRGVTADPAATWYNNGVTASITFYDKRAQEAGIEGYTKVTANDISVYLAKPKVVYNPATGLDQIICQAYLDFFRQPSEAWAWWKRTGYPNTTSTIAWEALTASGTPLKLPRRAPITILQTTDRNYANQQAAFKNMASDGNWGDGPNDFFGSVWWDMP